MLLTPPIARMLTKAGVLAVLWLFAVPQISKAAPRSAGGKFCDAQTTSIKKLIRQARAVGGPVAQRLRHPSGIRFTRPTGWLQRVAHDDVRDEDQAIQNDAPAAPLAADLAIDLRPVGRFIETQASPLFTHAPSPRSPRGPPNAA
jgi:hypothetical protein